MALSQHKISEILNFKGYFSNNEIEYGVHGPELVDGEVYISVYDYLQFKNKLAYNYDLLKISDVMSALSNDNDYIVCKYKGQPLEIKKFKFGLLEKRQDIFQKDIIKKTTLHDAIEKVLNESGGKLSIKKIADCINANNYYIRKDKKTSSKFSNHRQSK
jgi:hypothetical protein